MKVSFFVVTSALVVARCLPGQSIVGTWVGSIDTSTSRLLLLMLHVSDSAGELHASFDSLDQGAAKIPISSISQDGGNVTFASTAAHISYQGELSPDGDTIEGTWTQQQSRPLTWRRPVSSPIAGTWSGTLDTPRRELNLVFHIERVAGGFVAAMDSPDQHVSGIRIAIAERAGSQIRIEGPSGGSFEGTLSNDKSTIQGTWSQRGRTIGLLLKRAPSEGLPPPNRPQDPVKPYPYKEENVRFSNPSAGITLAGTLTIPEGRGPFPAVLLIGGSGPHNRDEEIAGHRPFLVLADYLTRKGIEVLRADKRGVGESGGSEFNATTADFVSDAQAGVALLRARPEVDMNKVGLIGHSEGGLIADIIASKDRKIDFVVMLAGPGVRGDQILPEQVRLLAEAAGVSHEQAQKKAREEAEVIAMAEKDTDSLDLRKKVEARFGNEWPTGMLDKHVAELSYPWTRYFLRYDPSTALRQVTCPVLALAGSKDLQVPPSQSLPAIRKALEAGGNKHFEIVELPGLNHMFQPAQTGSPSEYAGTDVTIAPAALDRIGTWILKQ